MRWRSSQRWAFTMLGRSVALALIDNDVAFVGLRFQVASDTERPIHTVSAPFVFNKSLSIRRKSIPTIPNGSRSQWK